MAFSRTRIISVGVLSMGALLPLGAVAQIFPTDMSEAYQVLYCSSKSGEPGDVLIVLSGEHFKHLVDGGPVTVAEGVWSAPYRNGIVTVGGGAFSFVSGTEIETGQCADLSENMRSAMLAAAKENPEAFRKYAKDVVVGPTD